MYITPCSARAFPKNSRRSTRRFPVRRVSAEQFRDARVFGGFTRERAADFLGVSLRTVGHWETGRVRPSYAAFRLLRVLRHGEFVDPAWDGFRLSRGLLWTPEGHSFTPGNMRWQSLLVRRANFQSLGAVRQFGERVSAATLRSRGCCGHVVDRTPQTGALLISAGAVDASHLPRIGKGSAELPSSNRGVSETERLAGGVSEPATQRRFRAKNTRHAGAGRPSQPRRKPRVHRRTATAHLGAMHADMSQGGGVT